MATEIPIEKKLNLRRMEKILRYLQYAGAAVLVVFAVLIVVSLISLKQLDATIDTRKQEIKDKGLELLKQRVEIEKQKKESAELAEKIKIQNAALDVYRSKERDPEDIAEIKKNIELTLSTTDNVAEIPPRIYMQISSEEQRPFAARISKLLQTKGYIVPGIENVHEKAPDNSEIRYYATDDASIKDVKDIQTNCASWGLKLDVPNPIRSRSVRPRHYEIWIGKTVGVTPNLTPVITPGTIGLP
jgi:hypothetical protein